MDNGPWNMRLKVFNSKLWWKNLFHEWISAATKLHKLLDVLSDFKGVSAWIELGEYASLLLNLTLVHAFFKRFSFWVIEYDSFLIWESFPWHCFSFHVSYNRRLDRILFENPSKILPIFLIIFQVFENWCMYKFQVEIKIQAMSGAKKYHKILVCNFQLYLYQNNDEKIQLYDWFWFQYF